MRTPPWGGSWVPATQLGPGALDRDGQPPLAGFGGATSVLQWSPTSRCRTAACRRWSLRRSLPVAGPT
eukprot:8049004-Alexandrium_andersonii.AAC.1